MLSVVVELHLIVRCQDGESPAKTLIRKRVSIIGERTGTAFISILSPTSFIIRKRFFVRKMTLQQDLRDKGLGLVHTSLELAFIALVAIFFSIMKLDNLSNKWEHKG